MSTESDNSTDGQSINDQAGSQWLNVTPGDPESVKQFVHGAYHELSNEFISARQDCTLSESRIKERIDAADRWRKHLLVELAKGDVSASVQAAKTLVSYCDDLESTPRENKSAPFDLDAVTEACLQPPSVKSQSTKATHPRNLLFDGLTVDWNDKNGGKSGSGAEFIQKAIYPKDSILEDLFEYGIKQTEGVEAYIIGSILPIAAAILARRTWMRMGNKKIYPNLFVMLAGKAGDRKSSTIDLYRALAQLALPEEAFIPLGFSPETLFDEYDIEAGGRPDKLWIVDDANLVLTDWGKSVNGERNASRFLILYDCCALSESYRRNKTKSNPNTRRTIPETSTSIIFGATFNVACFQGQQVRMGISRRFLNYVGDGLGRTHERPESAEFGRLAECLKAWAHTRAKSISTRMPATFGDFTKTRTGN